jgi:putative secretion ATPase (PEP-CTERM system associated)
MYDTFYSLTKKPFQLNPDPEFFFNSAVHKRALAYLRYGLAQGEGFVVVTGVPGTGKTMLVKELFETLDDENIVAGLMVTSHVGAEDTLRIVAATFGLSYDGDAKAIMLKNLENFFKEKAQEGKRVLLVVDEAQNLPPQSLEELRMLLNIELDGRSIFQIFLLGQEELRVTLQGAKLEQVRQRIAATYHLRPLDKDETREYILHRLTTANWDNDPIFSDQAFDEIFRFSGGIPRIINTLCDRLMLYGYLEELHRFNIDAVQLVIGEIEQDNIKTRSDFHSRSHSNFSDEFDFSMAEDMQPFNSNVEQRLAAIESNLVGIKKIIHKERALLRKAILIQLDLDDVYGNDNELPTDPVV